ncbi:MAG: hypothetical protein ABI237_05640 [Ginsengibacter sp.]
MTPTVFNPRKKNLLIKKNIIVRFDSINKMNKAGKSNKNVDTYLTLTTIPTTTI